MVTLQWKTSGSDVDACITQDRIISIPSYHALYIASWVQVNLKSMLSDVLIQFYSQVQEQDLTSHKRICLILSKVIWHVLTDHALQ